MLSTNTGNMKSTVTRDMTKKTAKKCCKQNCKNIALVEDLNETLVKKTLRK